MLEERNNIIMPKGVQTDKKWREYQIFPEEYFTGSDIYVYFNDVWLDELSGLSFSLNEIVNPVFGYASNTFDYVGRGRRIVKGQFRMAFKEAGYMFTVLDHIGQLHSDKTTGLSWTLHDGHRNSPKEEYGQVLERIEDILQRNHGDPNKKEEDTTKTEKQTVYFKWTVPMKMGETDSLAKHKNQENRYGHTTSIRQLQTWLKNNGYGWSAQKFTWRYYYGGDTWKTSPTGSKKAVSLTSKNFSNRYINNRIGRTSGRWYMMLRYWPESRSGEPIHKSIGTDGFSTFEAQLQKRLDDYPGDLSDMWMGSPDGNSVRYDGKYGRGVRAGVKALLSLAEMPNASGGGNWIDDAARGLLEAGFVVNGKYDFATKLAVWAFQQNMIKAGKLKKKAPDGIVDTATMALMTDVIDVKVTVPGGSAYKPEELAESRMTWYEKQVWGNAHVNLDTNGGANAVRKQESFFYRGRRHPDTGILYTEELFQKGFDIFINYGPLPQWVQVKSRELSNDLSFNTTVKAIRNIQLTDVEQVLDANTGQAIEEIYTFIAQDLD